MRYINHINCTFLCLAVLVTVVFGATAKAEDGGQKVSLSVAPSIIDKGGRPGETVPFSVTVTNDSSLVLPMHLFSRQMLGMERGVDSFVQKNNAEQWITFESPDFLLDAGKTKTITGALKIPSDVGPEGYYADIVVRPLSMQASSSTVHTQPELTVRVLTRISGKAVENVSATIDDGSTVIARRSSKGVLNFVLKNTGNVHELVRPILHITKNGKDVYLKDSGPMLLLPRETRTLSYDSPDTIRGGSFDARLEFSYGTPLVSAKSPSYLLIVLPFSPAIVAVIPAGLWAYAVWRFRERFVRAFRILAKGDKAGK